MSSPRRGLATGAGLDASHNQNEKVYRSTWSSKTNRSLLFTERVRVFAATLNVSSLSEDEYAQVVSLIEQAEQRKREEVERARDRKTSDDKIVSTSVQIT
jgi:hypothetical protein